MDRERLLQDNRRICIEIEQWTNHILSHKGLTAVQAHVLLHILRHPGTGISLTTLCREFGCSMPTLSNLLKRLREKGCIRVEHWEGDERRKQLRATEKGMALLPFLDQTAHQIQQQLYSCFTEEELFTLDRLQKKLLDNLAVLTQQAKEETTS